MNKLLKLTGVSVLTIVAATGANAAGYTCEELIEYTSCNDGYYLNSGKCIEGATCGAGNYLQPTCDSWDFANDWCFIEGALRTGWTQDSCEESGGEWYGVGCGNYDFVEFEAAEWVCTPCAAGTYQNVAGQDSCIICPAGSECATVGLATHTLCEIGEYSGAGATACSTCPTHMYTNANGQSVTVSATSNAGAGSPTACYIDPDTYFTDVTGTYHFKQECTYSVGFYVPSDGESCMDGYIYVEDRIWDGSAPGCYPLPATEAECEQKNYAEWTETGCECTDGTEWAVGTYYDSDTDEETPGVLMCDA